jgi:hypothetical protein
MFWGIIIALCAFVMQVSFFSFVPVFGFYPQMMIVVVVLGALFFRQAVFIYSVLFTALFFEINSTQQGSGFYIIWAFIAMSLVVVLKSNIIKRFNAVLGLVLLCFLQLLFVFVIGVADMLSGNPIYFAARAYSAAGSFVFNALICAVVYAAVQYLRPGKPRFL